MDDLIKQISDKYGISIEVSKEIADLILSQIKSKLPSSIAGQIDGFFGSSDSENSESLSDLNDTFGKLF